MGDQNQSRPHLSQIPHDTTTPAPPLPPPSLSLPPSESTSIATDVSQNAPQPLSKIPCRPRKIRKISTVNPSDENQETSPIVDSSTALTTSNGTTKSRRRNPNQPSNMLPKIIKPLSSEGEVDAALRHLRNSDPLLAALIDTHKPPIFDSFQPPFLALVRSILYQQLAVKAGASIYTRFLTLCGGEAAVLPDTLLSFSPQQLRQIGVSSRKSSYLHDLANKYKTGILSDSSILVMDDKSLFTMLTMVKGIGTWSVHMFMIFSLHRPDVLPVGDLGVRKGVQMLYNLEELPRPSQMEKLCENWKPYRSVGSWYMWRFVESKGISPKADALTAMVEMEPQQLQQQQHQLQLLEASPISCIPNLGDCIW